MKDFLKFNIGHVLLLIVWLVTVVWGYSDLNTRVKSIENNAALLRITAETLISSKTLDTKEASAQLSGLHSRMVILENDIQWIKKNSK